MNTATSGIQAMPVQLPTIPYLSAFQHISQARMLEDILGVIAIIWILYTLVLFYHWIRYGHRSLILGIVLAIHIFISANLFLFALANIA